MHKCYGRVCLHQFAHAPVGTAVHESASSNMEPTVDIIKVTGHLPSLLHVNTHGQKPRRPSSVKRVGSPEMTLLRKPDEVHSSHPNEGCDHCTSRCIYPSFSLLARLSFCITTSGTGQVPRPSTFPGVFVSLSLSLSAETLNV